MKIPQTITDRIIRTLVDVGGHTTHRTPPSFGLSIGRTLGRMACAADARHRNIARQNIGFALGDSYNDREIDRLVYQNFAQWGMITYEWMRLRCFDRYPRGRLPAPVEISGEKHLRRAKAKSQAVLLLSAHFGNWEYGHLHYAATINPLNFIVRHIDHPYAEKYRVAYNQHHGVNILYKEKGLKPAIRRLKKGEDLVIFVDQRAKAREGIQCRFFGKETKTLPIVAALAKKYNYPIVPMFVVRQPDKTSHKIVFLPELPYDESDTVESIAQRQNDVIETMIRKHPDHWLWIHKKWKKEYPEIYKRR